MLWSGYDRFGRFFDPWHDFELMSRELSRLAAPARVQFPLVNVWASEDRAVVTTEVPGIDPKALDISAVNSTLTLRGSRQTEEFEEGSSYHRRERWSGDFSKTIDLPFPVDPAKVEARYVKGVLYVSLPRAEADKPRKITVQAD